MSIRFWGVLIAIAVILGGVFVVTNSRPASAPGGNAKPTQHIEGQGKSGVKLVEYGDYECPVCKEYYPVVKQVAANYASQIYFQFRNFPLYQIHKNAIAGARAAEAAALQGKFWQMHDMLYEQQDPTGASGWVASNTPETYFDQFASQLGLNVAKFQHDYASAQVNNSVQADLQKATSLNLSGTPTFFLDGKQISLSNLLDANGTPSVAKFSQLINAEIAKKAGSTPASSSSPAAKP